MAERPQPRDTNGIHYAPVGAMLTGTRYDRAVIYVSTRTYLTEKFQTWVKENVLTMLHFRPLDPNTVPLSIHVAD